MTNVKCTFIVSQKCTFYMHVQWQVYHFLSETNHLACVYENTVKKKKREKRRDNADKVIYMEDMLLYNCLNKL